MIRKRIEIVLQALASGALLAVSPGHARQPAPALHTNGGQAMAIAARGTVQTSREVWSAPDTHAFPVYVEPRRRPHTLPPLEDGSLHDEVDSGSAFQESDDSLTAVADVPDIPYSYFWSDEDGLRMRARNHARRHEISEHSPGLWASLSTDRLDTRISGLEQWSFGAHNWQRQLNPYTELSVGSSDIALPVWNDSVRLGGLSLSQSFMHTGEGENDANWKYALSFGAVDHSAAGTVGDLNFGPIAGSLALSYDYSPRVTLMSQTEVADDLLMSDVTGQYDLGTWGQWRSGVSRSNQGLNQGWRYRVMGDIAVSDDIGMAWEGERYTDGFMDIRRYAGGASPIGGARQRWTASWDAGRWGTLSGLVESVHGREGVQERRFGLNQQFYYSPNLRVEVHAEREVVGGDYDIGLRFSFPLN